MFPDRFIAFCFVFAISCASMSISLTDIASIAAWTCEFIYHTTNDFIRDLGLQGTDKCSDLTQCYDWNNRSFDFIQCLTVMVPLYWIFNMCFGDDSWVVFGEGV